MVVTAHTSAQLPVDLPARVDCWLRAAGLRAAPEQATLPQHDLSPHEVSLQPVLE